MRNDQTQFIGKGWFTQVYGNDSVNSDVVFIRSSSKVKEGLAYYSSGNEFLPKIKFADFGKYNKVDQDFEDYFDEVQWYESERLYRLEGDNRKFVLGFMKFIHSHNIPYSRFSVERTTKQLDSLQDHKQYHILYEPLYELFNLALLYETRDIKFDLGMCQFLQRKDGHLVLNDPFFLGSDKILNVVKANSSSHYKKVSRTNEPQK